MNVLMPSKLDAGASTRLGGKGASLHSLGEAGFRVPPWFALKRGDGGDPEELARAISSVGKGPYAVRSSGMSEDGAEHSFAGQFESHLNVPAEAVLEKAVAVWNSAGSDHLLAYCRERGLPLPEPPVVLVQQMVSARCAGVAFSADPVDGRRDVTVVSATQGTGERLVHGDVDGEFWRFARDGSLVGNSGDLVLDETHARQVAELAVQCEMHFRRPQDIEWAFDKVGKLWLLQSRPITTLGSLPDPGDAPCVWDNSNIAESYGGVTTPMTFSFARRVYESVYREFCRMMGVPSGRMRRGEEVFPRMLGLVEGRVYYNLGSWYAVLAMLPGFRLNRAFMEQMMGVREPLPEELVDDVLRRMGGNRIGDSLALVRTCAGLVWRLLVLRRQSARFKARLDAALAMPSTPFHEMRGTQLVGHYLDLEARLLRRWDAPLVNDFFAMIFHGVLRSLCAKWLGDKHGSLQNTLLLDCGEIVSAEPPRRILTMARLAADVPGLAPLLADPHASTADKLASLRKVPALADEFDRYLADFGDRCLGELKLESPTVVDDPESLLCSIGTMAGRPDPDAAALAPVTTPDAGGLRGIKGVVFRLVLRQARERVMARENLRFERTRLFGRVRTVVRELGCRLCADGVLESPSDVFYLELEELLGHWDGTLATAGLGALAKARRAEFDTYRAGTPPPDRFVARGPLSRHAGRLDAPKPGWLAMGGASMKGSGACPGVVRGKVRVVTDPRDAWLEPGEILVARQTDPGWVVLFPAASGLLVERGSLLSHSAIVARELRLPCIVGLAEITTRLQTGMVVEMNGATGVVTVLEDPVEP